MKRKRTDEQVVRKGVPDPLVHDHKACPHMWKLPLVFTKNDGDHVAIGSSMFVGSDFTTSGVLKVPPGCHLDRASIKSDMSNANISWRTLAVALISALPFLGIGIDVSSPQGRTEAMGLTSLYVFLYKTFLYTGYDKMVKYIKCLKDWSLYYALDGHSQPPALAAGIIGFSETCLQLPWATGRIGQLLKLPSPTERTTPTTAHAFFQLYLMGKSLAKPTARKILKVLRTHRDDYTRVVNTVNLQKIAHGWSKQWAAHLTRLASQSPKTIPSGIKFGPGSSLTSSRSKGGKNHDAATELLAYSKENLIVPSRTKVAYSVFGEVSMFEDVLQTIGRNRGGHLVFPRKYLYCTLQQCAQKFDNSTLLARDLALAKLFDDGRLELPIPKGWEIHPLRGYWPQRPRIPGPPYRLVGPQRHRTVEIEVVLSRGDKARPINISQWEETVANQPVRGFLYALAKYDKEIPSLSGTSGLTGFLKRVKDVLYKRIRHGEAHGLAVQDLLLQLEIMSLDLSRCSDLILGQLNEAFLVGHYEGSHARNNLYLSWTWLLSASRREVQYRHPGIDDIKGCTGAPMMGDPPTWWVDNAYTKFVSMLAGYFADDEKLSHEVRQCSSVEEFDDLLGRIGPIEWDFATSELRVRCGDDELAFASAARNVLTALLYPLVGGLPSQGTNIRSWSYGVYCENHVQKGLCHDPRMVAEWVDILRVRSFTKPEFGLNVHVPWAWMYGTSITNTLKWFDPKSAMYKLACQLTKLIYHNEIETLYIHGLNAHAPRCLGGLDYPSTDGVEWSRATALQKKFYFLITIMRDEDFTDEITSLVLKLPSALADQGVVNPKFQAAHDRATQIVQSILDTSEGQVLSIEDLALQEGKSLQDWPFCNYQHYNHVVWRNGIQWIQLQRAVSYSRMRLASNEGLYNGVSSTQRQFVRQHTDAAEEIRTVMETILAMDHLMVHDLATLPSKSQGAGVVRRAMGRLRAIQCRLFISTAVLDEHTPVKSLEMRIALA